MRATAAFGFELDFRPEHAGNAFHNRQPQSEPARNFGALIEAVKLDEDVAPLGLRNADTGVVDVDADVIAAAPATEQHTARGRVFDGGGYEVLQQPAERAGVGQGHKSAGGEGEGGRLCCGKGGKFELDLAHHLVDTEACEFRTQRAGIETRHVEKRAENFLNGLERRVDVIDQPTVFAAAALDKACDVETGGVERLQDVVAGCRQELVLLNLSPLPRPLS